jgi:hypothetical protein
MANEKSAALRKKKGQVTPKKVMLKPHKVRIITESQAARIARAAFPELTITGDQTKVIEMAVNFLVSAVRSLVSPENRPNLDQLVPALKTLRNQLTPTNQVYLRLTGWDYQRETHPATGLRESAPNHVADTVAGLARSIDDILKWLSHPAAFADTVLTSLGPKAPMSVMLVTLPKIFEEVFGQDFGTGLTGPGMRFAAAVLRETGLRPRDDSDEKIAEMMKKRLQRKR